MLDFATPSERTIPVQAVDVNTGNRRRAHIMKPLISIALLLSALTSALPASAQNSCGSGGGTTVCVAANSAPSAVQLTWSIHGPVTRLQVFRSADSNPANRVLIGQPAASATLYADSTAVAGKPYWYWVRFTTAAGAYTSGASTAASGTGCAATPVAPFISVDGTRSAAAAATAQPGAVVQLAPEPLSGGRWAWSGCGTSGTGRTQNIAVNGSCVANVVHTNSCGGNTLQAFSLGVAGAMRNLTSVQLSQQMSPGINLGNTLEAIPAETSWGAPLTTQATMNGYKAAGFKSVRIPVAWTQYADENNSISPTWMARVKQVVDYARNANLYVVLNVHWDGGWMNNPTYAQQAAINAKLAKFWTQIATTFRDYDDFLLFAGTNEVQVAGNYDMPSAENFAVQNSFNQTFVNTVRATGSNNAKRHLVVQGYNTNIDFALAGNTLPKDSVANRLFMELHYYDPYNFTLNTSGGIWQWGASATNPAATETWANESHTDGQFRKLKNAYVDKGVAVIVGEYGAYMHTSFPDPTYRLAWTHYVTRSIHRHGLVPMWWDTGELFQRSTGAVSNASMVSTIVDASK